MLPEYRLGEEFFSALTGFDAQVAQRVAEERCPRCGGPLHQAHYVRKPRGALVAAAGEAFSLRHSLCCGQEGCRKRSLPPSLRFLGRRVYVEAVVVLASIVLQVATVVREACARTGVPVRTLRRWAAWWRDAFPAGRTWVELRARLKPPPPEETLLPGSLLARLVSDLACAAEGTTLEEACIMMARCMAPETSSSVSDGARFVRGLEAEVSPTGSTQKMALPGISGLA